MYHLVDAKWMGSSQADSAGIPFLNGRKVQLEEQ